MVFDLFHRDAALVEFLDQFVEVVRQVHRVAAELDRVGDVLQAVACDDGDDRVVRAKDALLTELLDGGGTRRPRRGGQVRRWS